MYRLTALSCIALALACAPAEEETTDTPEVDATTTTITLADVAGTWSVQTMPADRDTVLLTYAFFATAERDGWTITFPGRDPIPLRVVAVDGDSIVTEMGPFESALRSGVSVTAVRSVTRLSGGMLVGTFKAVYDTESADSVLSGRLHGMRSQ